MAEVGKAVLGRQLPLGIRLQDDATLANFLPGPDSLAMIATLQAQTGPQGERVIYLHGPSGSGKSHLLQAACHLCADSAIYLPLAELVDYPAAQVLQSVASARRICLDDVDAVGHRPDWEQGLFNLYNEAQQQGSALVLAANAAPRALDMALPDLRSRLSAGVVFQLNSADDEKKQQILQFRAARRGLSLADEVASYIVNRAPRDLEHLLQILDELDQASLEQQRALSIPFVKSVFGW